MEKGPHTVTRSGGLFVVGGISSLDRFERRCQTFCKSITSFYLVAVPNIASSGAKSGARLHHAASITVFGRVTGKKPSDHLICITAPQLSLCFCSLIPDNRAPVSARALPVSYF